MTIDHTQQTHIKNTTKPTHKTKPYIGIHICIFKQYHTYTTTNTQQQIKTKTTKT